MVYIRIRSFRPRGGRKVMADWCRGNSAGAADLDLALEYLVQRQRKDWRRPPYGILKGKCKGLGEIRFTSGGVEQRPLGFFSDDNEFTILYLATEKGGKFQPPSACRTALNRKKLVIESKEIYTYEWNVVIETAG